MTFVCGEDGGKCILLVGIGIGIGIGIGTVFVMMSNGNEDGNLNLIKPLSSASSPSRALPAPKSSHLTILM